MANGNYAYQPLAQFNPANLLNTRVAPVQLDPRNPGLEFNAAQTLGGFYNIRQGVRQDKALADAERLRQATVQAVGPGATQFDVADLEEYRQRFGAIPRDPVTGQANMDEVRQRLTNQKQLEQAFSLMGGRAGGAGGLGGMFGGGAPLKPDEQLKVQQDLNQLQESRSKAEEALALIRNRDKNVVGPVTGRSGFLYQLGAALGIDTAEKRFEDQRVLQMIVSENILKAAENMKGQLSDRDVKFLQAAVPKLTDTEDVWDRYFTRWVNMVDQQQQKLTQFLGGQISAEQLRAPMTTEEELKAAEAAKAAGVTGAGPGQSARYVPDGQGGTLRVNPDGTAAPATDEELEAQAQQALQADTPMTPPVAAPVPGVNPQDPISVQMLQRSVPTIPTNVSGVVTALGRTPITPVGNPAANYRLLRDLYRLATQPRPQAQPQIPVQPAPAPVIPRGQFRRSGRS